MTKANKLFILGLTFLFIVSHSLIALGYRDEVPDDKTLSPYFFVKGIGSELDQLPLKSTSADVNISGMIADVTVTQVYKNEELSPLEAVYVFPASTRAAVYGMTMTVGERVIEAKIRKKNVAKKEYEKAKSEGKSASLLAQQRPNVFQMNVANILPGDEIKVDLRYTELLIPEDGIYRFVYPTVVGPRYSNQPEATAAASEKWIQNPYLKEGETSPFPFNIKVNLSAGIPIQEMVSNTHQIKVQYDSSDLASAELSPMEKDGGNRDFILKYRLEGGKIETGLLLFEGEKENFFLMMAQPPQKITNQIIPKREYIFVVDVSGSMTGFPLDVSKQLLRDLIGNLRPVDTFNVILFAGDSNVMSKTSIQASHDNINRALTFIDNRSAGGGTELLPAMNTALNLSRVEGTSRSIVVVSDGYIQAEEDVFDLIQKQIGNTNIFAFGIGTGVNRFLIEGMARVGLGEPLIITDPGEALTKANKFREYIQSPVLTDIELDFGKFEVYDVEPSGIPDLFAERPVIVFGKWKGDPKGEIILKGISGDLPFETKLDVSQVKTSSVNSALPYLWARHRISLLSDYNKLRVTDERIEDVTRLGLKYNLLTKYTSFVAIDQVVRNVSNSPTLVKQPLPLPKNVSNYAVGNSVPGSPEPEEWLLIIIALIAVTWVYRRKIIPWNG